GAETYSVLHNLCHPNSPSTKTFKELCEILETHFTPPTIIFSERKKFQTSLREEGESVSGWYARVKKMALNCKFAEHLNVMILNHFIIGLPPKIFEKLCEKDESLTLEQALRKALIMETKLATKTTCDDLNVNYINKTYSRERNYNGQNNNTNHGSRRGNSGVSYNNGVSRNKCAHCGWKNHEAKYCKFRESKCYACKKIGQVASVCSEKHAKTVNYVSDSDSEGSVNNIFDYSYFSIRDKTSCGVYSLPVAIDGVNLTVACDTGAPCTLVSSVFYNNNQTKAPLRECKIPYLNYSGHKIPIIGEYDAKITYEGISKILTVVVSDTNSPPLLGRTFLRAFNFELMQVNSVGDTNNLSKMVPLYELLQKGNKFNWSNQCQKAYDTIKSDVTSDQVLVHFNPQTPIVLTTDASDNAIAGVLSHNIGGNLRPISYVSRALTKSEKNYSTLEKEALAFIFCVTKLRQYLLGNKLVLKTDHKPLTTLFGENKGLTIMTSARMQRWSLILSGFNYSVEYIKGDSNSADGLSRMPQQSSVKDIIESNYINLLESDDKFAINFKTIARETRRDLILSKYKLMEERVRYLKYC
ncbi:Retrovirus-related Pol polyprotein from transposon 412, partial [Lucilia cuprina]